MEVASISKFEKSEGKHGLYDPFRANVEKDLAFLRKDFVYRPCANCERHSKYPDILPVTLHLGSKCLLCSDKKVVELKARV
jgi:hypothetical protein